MASVNAAFWRLITPGRNAGDAVARPRDTSVPLYRLILQKILYWWTISLSNDGIRAAGCHCLVVLDGDRFFFGDKRERSRRVFFRGQADGIFRFEREQVCV